MGTYLGLIPYYDRQPLLVRLLLAVAGVALVAGTLLEWRVTYGFTGRPEMVTGLERASGIVVLIMGLATLAAAAWERAAAAGILTGLAAGALTGLELIDVLALPAIADSVQEVGIGLVISLGGAAIAGAGGICALAVAASVAARSDPPE